MTTAQRGAPLVGVVEVLTSNRRYWTAWVYRRIRGLYPNDTTGQRAAWVAAQDLVSSAEVKLLNNPPTEISSPRSYVRRVLRNRANDHFRAHVRGRRLLDEMRNVMDSGFQKGPVPPDRALEETEEKHMLRGLLDDQDPVSRAILTLCVMDDEEQKAVAAVVGKSQARVCQKKQENLDRVGSAWKRYQKTGVRP
jgi:RNA polymerase sigma factor (sigma-70 family)